MKIKHLDKITEVLINDIFDYIIYEGRGENHEGSD